MTGKIVVLPSEVAEKIAAGEVVPRPAAAVKELLDNALDAGAGRVEVDVYLGGIDRIVVADDGCGMDPQDLPLCIQRHATSKIRTLDDLLRLATFGFRGEALAAIASVSQLEILSRTPEATTGYRLRCHGGVHPMIEPAGCPVGTRVTIANLFYNVPARRKFLKTVPTEFRHVCDAFTRVALAAERVHLALRHNDRLVLALPQAADRLERLLSLWGAELEPDLVPVLAEREGVAVSGYISRPSVHRNNPAQLFILANDRVVANRNLVSAVLEGYRNLMERGRYPVGALYLDVDPETMDINVHPSKLEVRFTQEGKVFGAIVSAVRAALETSLGAQAGGAVVQLPRREAEGTPAESGSAGRDAFLSSVRAAVAEYLSRPQAERRPMLAELAPERPPRVPAAGTAPAPELPAPRPEPPRLLEGVAAPPAAPALRPPRVRPLARLFGLFIIAEADGGLLIVDAHAAHERVNYEIFRRQLARSDAVSQRLLFPIPVELGVGDAELLEEQEPFFARLGFQLQRFGPESYALASLPPRARMEGAAQLVRDVLAELGSSGQAAGWEARRERALITLACHSSTRANDAMDEEDMKELLQQWYATPNREVCPHGRPISVLFSESDLYKLFKRT